MKTKYPVLLVRGGIYDDTLLSVGDTLSGKRGELLYFVIESLGGDPSIGYRIMSLLQAKYDKIIAVVPGEAYSTATLMVLGADEIYMQESACLGPLDIQIKHPTDGTMISTLEIREVLNTLAGSVKTYAEDFFESLKSNVQLGKKDAAELSMRAANDIVKPVIEKIDPIYLQSSIRTSRIGQKYAENLLASRMMKDFPKLARMVSVHLANNYDYHGYAITPKEASDVLALNVMDVDSLAEWENIKEIYKKNTSNGVKLFNIATSTPGDLSDADEKDMRVSAASAKSKKPKSSNSSASNAKIKTQEGE